MSSNTWHLVTAAAQTALVQPLPFSDTYLWQSNQRHRKDQQCQPSKKIPQKLQELPQYGRPGPGSAASGLPRCLASVLPFGSFCWPGMFLPFRLFDVVYVRL